MYHSIFVFRQHDELTQVLPIHGALQMSQICGLREKSNAPDDDGQRDDEPRPRSAGRARGQARFSERRSRRSSTVVVHGNLAGRALAEHGVLEIKACSHCGGARRGGWRRCLARVKLGTAVGGGGGDASKRRMWSRDDRCVSETRQRCGAASIALSLLLSGLASTDTLAFTSAWL